MRPTRWILASLVLAAACAHRPPPTPEAATAPALSPVGDWARLQEPVAGGAIRFTIDRPAYVAVFGIVPGEGTIRLLYPTSAQQSRREQAGTYTRATRRELGSRSRRVARLNRGFTPSPLYLYLIASDRPLDLLEPLSWPDGRQLLSTSVGDARLDPQSNDVERTFELLFDLVVTDPDAAEVDTDVFSYYPDVRFQRNGRMVALSAFRCYDGRVVFAPASYGDDFFPSSWYGVDFARNQYVGAECYSGYFVGGQPGSGPGVGPTLPGGTSAQLDPRRVTPRDVRPSIPTNLEQPRTNAPGTGGAQPASGYDQLLPNEPAGASRPEPRIRASEPRLGRPGHPRASAPDGMPSRPEPRAEPRAEPVSSVPVRSEPIRQEPPPERRAEPQPRPEPRVEPRAEPRVEPRSAPESQPRPTPEHPHPVRDPAPGNP